jgi:hypothetical protein
MSESDFTLPIDPAVREMGINNLDTEVYKSMSEQGSGLGGKEASGFTPCWCSV